MNIQLIQGEFNPGDALELISKMIEQKIKYQENRISKYSSEEDIKYRESKIRYLQNELFELSNYLHSSNKNMKIEAIIKIE